MGRKKTRKVIMFVWWFMVASGSGGINVNAIGPFDSYEQCEYARIFLFKGIKTSQCWGVH